MIALREFFLGDEPCARADREETIRGLLHLVERIAGRLAARLPAHIARDELISAGVAGLIDAVDRYDAGKGCSLKTYSGLRIRGAMVDELRRQDWVPRTVHRDGKLYEEARQKLGRKLGREARPEEVRRELGMTVRAFERFLIRVQTGPMISLNESWRDEDGIAVNRGDLLACPDTRTPFEEAVGGEERLLLRGELGRLPKAERFVLRLHYLEDLRLREIAERMEVKVSRVSQIHREGLRRLGAAMRRARDR
ncbi:MAG TPA: FliA/WhiG family RNA polymerase sigma factor [Candidatus Methylacidiphilales bacterium]|jgi:RNA polymerase sigma factor for flagellar operon FliA|nr:FliA/WhiG family RNA polymerase sigma factor [Candidatus Methylacidiphilales bacterium]